MHLRLAAVVYPLHTCVQCHIAPACTGTLEAINTRTDTYRPQPLYRHQPRCRPLAHQNTILYAHKRCLVRTRCSARACRIYHNPFDRGVVGNVTEFLLAVTGPPIAYTSRGGACAMGAGGRLPDFGFGGG